MTSARHIGSPASPLLRARRLGSAAPLLLAVAPLLAPAALSPLHAQTVRGTVSSPDSAEPLWGAVVLLLEGPAGEGRAAGTITDEGGRYLIRVPEPGVYRLRAERIGFRSVTTEPFAIAADEAVHRALRAPVQAVPVEEIQVVGETRCRRIVEGAETAYRLWEEARKALVATVITAEMDPYWFDAVLWERRLHPRSLRVREEELRTLGGRGRRPFRSIPAQRLAAGGWVQETDEGTMYYGPDAQLLLSGSFIDDHCFYAREGEEPGSVGLGFEPMPGRDLPEIAGTLWLDATSAELQHLEYRYVNLDLPVRSDAIGGAVVFDRLPDGGWIVRRWWIRMPQITLERVRSSVPGRIRPRDRPVLSALKEDGGEIRAVRREDGTLVRSYEGPDRPVDAADGTPDAPEEPAPGADTADGEPTARIVGRVIDDGSGRPVASARVSLVGTELEAFTDEGGRFAFAVPPAGPATLRVDHIGYGTRSAALDVPGGGAIAVTFRVAVDAVPVEPISVTILAERRRRDLERVGFYDRQAGGRGVFIAREEIEELRPIRVTDVLRRVPGLELIPKSESGNYRIRVRSAPASLLERDCPIQIYLDGALLSPVWSLDAMVRIDNVAGVEVYTRPSQIPARFRASKNARCGVIAVWTRER